MTVTERERRRMELVDGGANRTDLCEQLAMREYELDDLKEENDKLRELCADMYKAFMHGNCYRWCEFKEPCNYISDGRCQWYDRMRELTKEVVA